MERWKKWNGGKKLVEKNRLVEKIRLSGAQEVRLNLQDYTIVKMFSIG